MLRQSIFKSRPSLSLATAKNIVYPKCSSNTFPIRSVVGNVVASGSSSILLSPYSQQQQMYSTSTTFQQQQRSPFAQAMLQNGLPNNLTLTENQGVTFKSTTSHLLDFFFGAVKGIGPDKMVTLLDRAWAEDSLMCLKLIFHLKHIKLGKGERLPFYYCMNWLREHHPKTLLANIHLIPQSGYWKDLLYMLDYMRVNSSTNDLMNVETALQTKPYYYEVYHAVVNLFVEQIKSDMEMLNSGKSVMSVAAKWAPSIKHQFDKKLLIGSAIATALFPPSIMYDKNATHAKYIQIACIKYHKEYLTPLRSASCVIEPMMSSRRWSEIPYERVPSKCMKASAKLFARHDKRRFQAYLTSVEKGECKINASAIYPHEIVAQFLSGVQSSLSTDALELQWKQIVKETKEAGVLSNCVAVCDVSGSMAGEPMTVSIALGMLVSEVTSPPFNNILCTFSEEPEFIEIQGNKLSERIKFIERMPWGMNTDFEKVFTEILSRAKEANLEPSDMVKQVFVFSDMEFDEARTNPKSPHLHTITQQFKDAGYEVPQLIFWNLRGSANAIPAEKHHQGVALVSGFSPSLLKLFMAGDVTEITPTKIMEMAVWDEFFSQLRVVDRNVLQWIEPMNVEVPILLNFEIEQGAKQRTYTMTTTPNNSGTNSQQLFTLDNYDESQYTKFSFFWQGDSPFSQWHQSTFTVNNVTFSYAEQFMMYEKAILFGDVAIANKVLQTKSPKTQKALGRKVSNFDQETWDRHCVDIVYRGNFAKFSQNPHLKAQLLALQHREREFVEASPSDRLWGIGMLATDAGVKHRQNWKGKNLLGKILTCVRNDLVALEEAAA